MNCKINQEGYVVLIITFFIMIIMLSVALSMGSLIVFEHKITTNSVKSTQSYYAAESGIEDALLYLKKYPQVLSVSTYPLIFNNEANADVTISAPVGGSITITSKGNNYGITKNIQAVCSMDGQNINFYYGIEVGNGGLVMNNGSEVDGNVFSNGNITGSGTINNNAIISGSAYSLQGVHVKRDAFAHSCNGATIDGNLTYVEGGTHNCTVAGTLQVQSQEIEQQPLPISQSQIDSWRKEASVPTPINGNVNLSNNETRFLGPVKITGSLNFGNKSILVITGTVYVQGDINLGNNDIIKLDNSYGSSGGILISDGLIDTGTGNIFSGSGQNGSYLLILSTSTSDSAISLKNNSAGAAFYTSTGGLQVPNNVSILEATGYKLVLGNGASIQSSSGAVNIFFSSGPSGGWKVKSWSEQ